MRDSMLHGFLLLQDKGSLSKSIWSDEGPTIHLCAQMLFQLSCYNETSSWFAMRTTMQLRTTEPKLRGIQEESWRVYFGQKNLNETSGKTDKKDCLGSLSLSLSLSLSMPQEISLHFQWRVWKWKGCWRIQGMTQLPCLCVLNFLFSIFCSAWSILRSQPHKMMRHEIMLAKSSSSKQQQQRQNLRRRSVIEYRCHCMKSTITSSKGIIIVVVSVVEESIRLSCRLHRRVVCLAHFRPSSSLFESTHFQESQFRDNFCMNSFPREVTLVNFERIHDDENDSRHKSLSIKGISSSLRQKVES